jgi:hypothetical protein
LLKLFYAPLLPPQELVNLLDKPLIKSLAELIKKTIDLLPQPSENCLVCKLPCALTEAMHGPMRGTSRRTRCCFTPHYKWDQVPFKIPVLITAHCYKPNRFCWNPDIAAKINQLFMSKCTAIQSIMLNVVHMKTKNDNMLSNTSWWQY